MKASLEASQPVDEEPFEIHIDTQGCEDGPKTARLRAATNVSIHTYQNNILKVFCLEFILTLYFLCQAETKAL